MWPAGGESPAHSQRPRRSAHLAAERQRGNVGTLPDRPPPRPPRTDRGLLQTRRRKKKKNATVTDKSQTEAFLLFICRQIGSAWAALFIPQNKPFQHVSL